MDPVLDSVGLVWGDMSGLTYCYERTFSVSSVPITSVSSLPASALTIDATGKITVDASALGHNYLGSYAATVRVAFSDTNYADFAPFTL